MITMKFLILTSLPLYILAYHCLISVLTNSTCKITITPEFTSPEYFLYIRTTAKYLPCRQTLDHLHDLFNTICRHRLNQEMHVVIICPYLQELQLISLLDLQTDISQLLICCIVKNGSSILCRKYQVIHQCRYIMALVNIFAHSLIFAASCGEYNPKSSRSGFAVLTRREPVSMSYASGIRHKGGRDGREAAQSLGCSMQD